LNKETIAEQEAFCMFRDYWQRLSCIQPNLLGKLVKKYVKKASKKLDLLDVLDLQLSPSGFRHLSLEKPKTPAAPKAKKALVAKTTPVVRKSRKAVTSREAVGITADVGVSRALLSDRQCHFYGSKGSVPEAFYTGISTVLSVSPVLCIYRASCTVLIGIHHHPG
jgi:hypothetical protein